MAGRISKHRWIGAALAGIWLAAAPWTAAPWFGAAGASPTPDPLAARGYAVTSGAAPGYVDDRVCAGCHTDLFESYREVSMSRAFYRPRSETAIEDFSASRFFHPASERWYQMSLEDGRYRFRRYQLDAEERPVNVFEQDVDWILGSGSHARTYLYRTPGGELFQLPVAWYSQTASWGMAPGYDRRDHNGVTRKVLRECMFCHNAYPELPAGADAHDAPQTYPEQLPEGLGCQRCHGPGAEHARAGMSEPVDFQHLADSIVNPAEWSPDLRQDLCYGCHMQPAVAIDSVRRFGRGDFSFRPGEPLADYLVHLDMVEAGRDRSHRFEINHHPYRLEQSRCFVESRKAGAKDALSCLTCHDPHRKVPEPERAAHYRAACESCHQVDACRLEEMTASGSAAGLPAADPGDCVACHMQQRRPEDAARVTMTDHFIRRRPGGAELLAPLEEEAEPEVADVTLLSPERAPPGRLGEVYRATAAVRAGGGTAALDWLERSLDAAGGIGPHLDPYLDLVRGRLEHGQLAAAQPLLARLLERSPEHPWLLEWQAISAAGLGRPAEALAVLRRAVELHPREPGLLLQLGRLLTGLGRPAEGLPHLERALELQPNRVKAHRYLGDTLTALGRHDAAADSFRRALAVEPSHTGAYLSLAQALRAAGDRPEALRMQRHGARVADRPEAIRQALAGWAESAPGR